MADSLVVGSKVRELISKEGCMTSGDLTVHLSKVIEKIVVAAVERAKSNGRRTVRGHDL